LSKFLWFGIVVALGLGLGAFYILEALPDSAEEALRQFNTKVVAEDQIMDPLILAGKKVVPLVLKEIENKDMSRRRYAIAALGHLGDSSALPTLESILKDPSEVDYFRCDALEAIALLDSDVGRTFAKQQIASSVNCLSQISQSLVAGKLPNRRTYLQALLRWHQ